MSQPPLHSDPIDEVADAAAHWCMRLQEADCTEGERRAFERWLAADTAHAREFAAMQEIWDLAGQLPGSAPLAPEPAAVTSPAVATPALPRRRRFSRQNWAVAAMVCALALPLAAWTAWEQDVLPDGFAHVASTDELRTAQLPDGTQVELNLGSSLTFLNFKHHRQVWLSRGEAYFEVAHDSRHPFTVKVGTGRVTVTGTRFNVWQYQDQVRVTLFEGSVLVSNGRQGPEHGYRLTPGMQASFGPDGREPSLRDIPADDSTLSWRDGKLILDDLALAQALPQINRYLQTPVVLADPTIAQLHISGTFQTRNIDRMVTSLPKVLPLYLTRNDKGETVLNRISPTRR